ncbi:50S ribosomal protein L9 [Arenicella chitinivorans]|uniref:Large ribosomal subunit protein bL9 n=1 Tax=Arenicella chitinivorans TaxID=1329800 RepID=A0A918RLE3_9GAMM|nr:50S ribosomal protein L9 [Arenicella chitinivorans]GHA01675.1 50S ribosomal protein L9 [Arenicella chitinivorans]
MQVILLEKIVNLGNLGDMVTVKPGYARNYLVPQGLATVATAENIKLFEERRLELEKASADKLQAAQGRAKELEGQSVEIAGRASDEGKLFGSVGVIEIADAFSAKGLDLNKSEIQLPEGPIKTVGEYEVAVSVHPEVHFEVTVVVVPE